MLKVTFLLVPNHLGYIIQRSVEVLDSCPRMTVGDPVQNSAGYDWVVVPRHLPQLLSAGYRIKKSVSV